MLKIFLTVIFIFLCTGRAYSYAVIDAEKNAYRHNNKGLLYLEDKYYYGAIKEFEIAIDLLPNSQASATFYTNMGKTYERAGHPELATQYYEKALSLNALYFDYYLQLAENYKKTGKAGAKLEYFRSKTNTPLNDVMTGLLYIQEGYVSTGISILDDFCDKEPDLIITFGIKKYIKKITKEKL